MSTAYWAYSRDPWERQRRAALYWLWMTKPRSGRSAWALTAFKDIRLLIARLLLSRDYLVLDDFIFTDRDTRKRYAYRSSSTETGYIITAKRYSRFDQRFVAPCNQCLRPLEPCWGGNPVDICPVHGRVFFKTRDLAFST